MKINMNINNDKSNISTDDLGLPKTYSPKDTEERIYSLWEKSHAFSPSTSSTSSNPSTSFSITIPPPNVTGSLHMGHALNGTCQDILIRRARMQGKNTLWLPGTDHAGIATQNVVEKQLAKEGINKNDISREEFLKRINEWVDKYGDTIISQLRKMGFSCDWSRKRYTMDDDYKEAVNVAFKHYYDKGLIYQGERVINWCTRCQTALSDIEVEHNEAQAILYYFKYDRDFPITIATTRPETKLGDVAVAVNPDDKRYKEFIDKTYDVNFCGVTRKIKIIGDKSVDPKFGTGALGVTPAHSIADAELAQKHNLPSITVIDKFGKISLKNCIIDGLKTKEAREKILEKLKKENLLEKEEKISHNLSVCYRCSREIEPQPSKQWFLKMKELIKPAISAIKNDEIKLTPAGWKKVYLDWMENIHDWCISRQIIWGHQLPVYIKQEAISNFKFQISNSDADNKNIYVGDNPPEGFEQVSDVLDTWFSSALWPFAVFMKNSKSEILNSKQYLNSKFENLEIENSLKIKNLKFKIDSMTDIFGENAVNEDMARYYPTSLISTARDINMLWVVRMIFSGFEFTGQKPFYRVYIHPTVFNKDGKRMSKSLGTGVDPIELIDKYGADAVRFGLSFINTGTQDIKFDENAILAGQKFANKMWNIARFVLQQNASTKSEARNPKQILNSKLKNLNIENSFQIKTDADKKILESLNDIILSVNNNLDAFRFGQAAHVLYDFVWHDFADVYIENWKIENSLKIKNLKLKIEDCEVLLSVLAASLRLLHPFMPFVTEEIWQKLYEEKLVEEKMLIMAKWPEFELYHYN